MSRTSVRIKDKAREIISMRHRLAKVMPFEDYAAKFDPMCYHLLESNRQTTVLASEFFGKQPKFPEPCKLPDMYWAELKNAKIIGGSDVVLTSDNKMLYDMLARCDEYNANMTDQGLFLLFGKPHHIGKRYFYNYIELPDNYIEKGICLASNMSNNYYHFMFQVAAKFYYIDLVGFGRSIPLLVDEQVLSIPQMKEVIVKLNKGVRKIIPLRSRVLYEVGDLYCISDPNVVVPNRKKISYDRSHAFAFDKKALDYLRTRIMDTTTKDNEPFAKRVFLSRKDCKRRNVNENELKPILEKYGFEFVYSGEMDIASQACLFHQAEHIIGPSGAAFTNLLFCSKGCQVLLFVSHHHNTTCYSSLAAPLEVSTMFLAGNGNTTKLHSKFYKISPELLEQYLQSMFG